MFSRTVRKCINSTHSLIISRTFTQIQPDFTKNTYKVARGKYNYLHEGHINFFRSVLSDHQIITDLSDLEKYNVDWYAQLRGASTIVLKPKSTEEVVKLLSFCNDNKLAVCPQGGNTGVVGGGVPVFDEVIISTELMNKIISLDDTTGVMVCESGCILENLDNILAKRGLMVPLDLGSKGSCHIGGNVSTNAGGFRLSRYGNLHGNVLGVEVVTANGSVLDLLSTLKKDNTGYHLKHLFIGSEGSLGFVTKVAFQCPPRPKSINVAFLGVQSFQKVLKTFKKAKQFLGEIISATEVLDTPTMEFNNDRLNLKSPIGDFPFYLLIETSGSNEVHDSEKLNSFLDHALSEQLILNGTVATEPSKIEAIWALREKIPQGFKKEGYVFCYDLTIPLDDYFTIVDDMRRHMGDKCIRVFGYGHLGDCNLHLQISAKKYSQEIKDLIEPYIFEKTLKMKGSISAEHGMGFLKGKYLEKVNSELCVKLMKDLKNMFDPNGILNPYKVFP